MRAEETILPDAYIQDPLAAILAGDRVMKQYRAFKRLRLASSTNELKDSNNQQDSQAALVEGDSKLRGINNVILRTLYFDDGIMMVLGKRPSSVFTAIRASLGSTNCKQVVLLGSGMDSRPWRLHFPPGVTWFEVDRQDVLKAKMDLLRKAGAAFTLNPGSTTQLKGTRFPLQCQEWKGVSLDLQVQGWSAHLLQNGFDPEVPTLWVLEGLLYYLEPDAVPEILKESARISAQGSVMLASIFSREFLEVMKKKGAYQNRNSIASEWKWACPVEPSEYFGGCGWNVLSSPSWTEAAEMYGLKAIIRASTKSMQSSESQQTVASTEHAAEEPVTVEKPKRNVMYITAVVHI
ncbi:hypothetical protein CEUSTIGMA_g10590.t1 [Chlamydomonas eustigma]|uniref:S-adenosyl-L-methionine-dependent methyltransferase n=1 Tax=Chlamydomonas eustigma TaxID=1157962 RepID=A0A250XJB2_9CHLO|nr:hypothetical protein CEUSTIGMA_g10590.t1 [Chlamydomonas eustigma]|eukprot:GAX83164.1 hypothetical protein CEUSTIGMA_g10590.t1 [Chlamydomonas eustigma]